MRVEIFDDGPRAPEALPFLGLGFHPLTARETLDRVLARSAEPGFAYLATPNVDHMVRLARADARVRSAYEDAWLVVNDSRILARLARMAGLNLPVAPGSDLVAALLADPRLPRDAEILVVGGDRLLAQALRARFGLTRLRQTLPPFGLREDPDRLAAAVAEAEAAFPAGEAGPVRLVLIAIGSPQQELFAQALLRRRRCAGVGLCIGAGLEFLTGVRRRAPAPMQRLGLEWAYRLASEPRRMWRRYLVDGPRILPLYLADLRRRRETTARTRRHA